jgi:hypothetical protein
MSSSAPFRLNRSALLLVLVSAALAGEAGAAAGRAEFIIGGVTIAGRDGVQRPLARGTELDNGDTVRTNDGRAQIRFTDGAYVSLQPNTEYSIRDYRFDAGNERGFFGLVRGAMRTVTGAIGRINRDRYQIQTPTATVGIRGTGGVIQVQDDGSTLVIGTSGIWSLTNPAGSVDVPAGTSALAPTDPNQPPQESTQAPTSGPAPMQEPEPEFVAGEERDVAGNPIIPPPEFAPLVSGSGYVVTTAHVLGGIPTPEMQIVDATFNPSGQLTRVEIAISFVDIGNGSHADFGTDGVLAWGRWTGEIAAAACQGTFCSPPLSANQGFHYVVGMPTAIMPITGSFRYDLAGATSPTYVDGRNAPGSFSGFLEVYFGQQTLLGSFTASMSDGVSYQWNSGTTLTSSQFSLTGTPTSCSTCFASVSGFFAGTNAERAGVSYVIADPGRARDVLGAAAFQQGAAIPDLVQQRVLVQGGL